MDANRMRRWIRDEYEDRARVPRETFGAWHLHELMSKDKFGGWYTRRACDDGLLFVDAARMASNRVREEKYPVHEAYSCPACVRDESVMIEARFMREEAVKRVAEAFDVPEYVIDGGSARPDKVIVKDVADLVERLRRDLRTAESSRDEWTEKAAHHVRENERLLRVLTTRAQERDDAVHDREAMRRERDAARELHDAMSRRCDDMERERDNAVRVHALMSSARDRDSVAYDRMKRERNEAVQASVERVRERDEAVAEAAEARRALDDLRAETSLKAWKGTKIVVEDVPITVDALHMTYGLDTLSTDTTTRYGGVSWVGGALPYEPFCALCPGIGRTLLRRSSRENATDGLVFHVLRHHAKTVPVITAPDGVTSARCQVPGCEHRSSAANARNMIVRHEVTEHPQGDANRYGS